MLNREKISEKIKAIIANNLDENEHIDFKKNFEDLGVGSLMLVKIMVELEIEFDMEFDDNYYTFEYHDISEFVNKITVALLGENGYDN